MASISGGSGGGTGHPIRATILAAIMEAASAADVECDEAAAFLVYVALLECRDLADYTYTLSSDEEVLVPVLQALLPGAVEEIVEGSAADRINGILVPAGRAYAFVTDVGPHDSSTVVHSITIVPATDDEETDAGEAGNANQPEVDDQRTEAFRIIRDAMFDTNVVDTGDHLATRATDFFMMVATATDPRAGDVPYESSVIAALWAIFPEGADEPPAGSPWEKLNTCLLGNGDGFTYVTDENVLTVQVSSLTAPTE